jgi:hypothetical protein
MSPRRSCAHLVTTLLALLSLFGSMSPAIAQPQLRSARAEHETPTGPVEQRTEEPLSAVDTNLFRSRSSLRHYASLQQWASRFFARLSTEPTAWHPCGAVACEHALRNGLGAPLRL